MEKYWGYHLILNVGGCDVGAISDAKVVEEFTKTLVKDIDMVAYGEPQIVKFGTGDKEGFTLMQLIETSNICCHFVDSTGAAYLDVFSCKDFEPNIVVKLFWKFFNPTHGHAVFIKRDEQETKVVYEDTFHVV